MKRIWILIAGLMLATIPNTIKAQTNNGNGCVQLTVTNLQQHKGKVWVVFYDNPNTFPDPDGEVLTKAIPVQGDSTLDVSVCSLRQGWYAVAAFQDLDNDGDLTTNAVGLPIEPFGYSNNARAIAIAPTFRQCRFYVADGSANNIGIDLVRHK